MVRREQIHTPSWEEWERERHREHPRTPMWLPPLLSTEAAPLSTRPDAARWLPAPQPVAAYTNMAQALREDEELLLLG